MILQALAATCEGDGNDLGSYCLSSRALMQGGNPYDSGSPFPYIYPLFLLLLLSPLAVLPCSATALIWALGGLASLVAALVVINRNAAIRLPAALLVVLGLVYFDVIQNNVVNGQVNFLVLFLCAAGFLFSRRERDLPAAMAFGAAAAIKLTPLIMLCFLAARRRWLAAGAMLGFFLLFCLLPGLVPGVDIAHLYGEYGRGFLAEKLTDGTVPPSHVDFSLAGILTRVGWNVNPLGPMVFLFLIPGAFLLWDALALRRNSSPGSRRHDLRAFTLYLLAPLFVVPMSEIHHLAFALPAYVCLFGEAVSSGRKSHWILPTAALAVYLIGSIAWREGPFYFLSLALLVLGIILADRREELAKSSGPGPGKRSWQTGDRKSSL
jgi:hypothetical protein